MVCGSDQLRAELPVLASEVFGKPIAHWDTAIATPVHTSAIDAMVSFCERVTMLPEVSVHELGARASDSMKLARQSVARFIGARESEVVFLRNATDAMRLVASGYSFKPGAEVLISEGEHYSNLLNWVSHQRGQPKAVLLKLADDGTIDLDLLEQGLTKNVKLVSLALVSHVTGVVARAKEIAEMAHQHGALLLLDATQAAGRMPIDVLDLGCDFMAFSSAQLYAAAGVGVLYGRRELLDEMVFKLGGGSVRRVDAGGRFVIPADLPQRAESGSPNGAGAAALGEAVRMLTAIGMENIEAYERSLAGRLLEIVRSIPGARVLGPDTADRRIGIVSFTIEALARQATCQQLSSALSDTHGVLCSGGPLDALPLLARLDCADGIRLSGGIHSNEKDLLQVGEALQSMLGKGS